MSKPTFTDLPTFDVIIKESIGEEESKTKGRRCPHGQNSQDAYETFSKQNRKLITEGEDYSGDGTYRTYA